MIIINNIAYQVLHEENQDIAKLSSYKEYVVRNGKSILYMITSENLFYNKLYNISDLQNLICEINYRKWRNENGKIKRLLYLNGIKQIMREYIIEDVIKEEEDSDWC